MLLHARPHLPKASRKSVQRVGTIALLSLLSSAWEHEFLLPSMAFNTASAFDIICQLDRNDALQEVPHSNKQKPATGLLLVKLHKQDFAGPLACRASKVLGVLGYLLVSFASSVMGFVLCVDFTLLNMITPAVLDAQMNLALSLITMSVPGCITSFYLSGDMLRYCHREIFYMT